MSPLMLMASLSAAAVTCAGSEAEVPVHFVGWADADAAWLEQELTGWVAAHDRRLCAGREGQGLSLEASEAEVTIHFDFQGVRRTRTIPGARPELSSELFRYQVAAAAEELVRSTWEAPPPARFEVLGRAELAPLESGPLLSGGSLGAAVFLLPSLGIELAAGGAAMPAQTLATGGTVSGTLVRGTLSLSWLPLRVGIFRAGPRASVQAGALWLKVTESGSTSASGTTPWLAAGAGATVGLETRHVSVQLVGEVSSAFLGASVLSEGVPVERVRGLMGTFALQAGWLW